MQCDMKKNLTHSIICVVLEIVDIVKYIFYNQLLQSNMSVRDVWSVQQHEMIEHVNWTEQSQLWFFSFNQVHSASLFIQPNTHAGTVSFDFYNIWNIISGIEPQRIFCAKAIL